MQVLISNRIKSNTSSNGIISNWKAFVPNVPGYYIIRKTEFYVSTQFIVLKIINVFRQLCATTKYNISNLNDEYIHKLRMLILFRTKEV